MAALQRGKMTEQDVDKALKNLFAVRMRLGHFDGDPRNNALYGSLGAKDVCSRAHKDLALEAAQNGIVLLKNDASILPLDRLAVNSVAVIGPNADNPAALNGNYFGPPCETTTPRQGLQRYVKDLRFHAGCNSAACDFAATDQADKPPPPRETAELHHRHHQRCEAARDTVVILSGGPVDVTFAKSNPKIGAILWAGYPGQAGGLAIANVLFGDHNPSGRLPVTWYPEEFTRVPMTDMRMRADPTTGYPGRSYRFYKGKTVYKFDYGLSYSHFSRRLVVSGTSKQTPIMNLLSGLTVKPTAKGGASYDVEELGVDGCEQLKFPAMVEVQNHGPLDGKHSVLMFLRWPNVTGGRPVSQLVGFRSQHLKVGEKASLRFDVSPCEHFSTAGEDGRKVIDTESHFLMVDKDESEISL
ncbi:hypothetical protein ACQ4PT_000275 [Festuca glaucescens]